MNTEYTLRALFILHIDIVYTERRSVCSYESKTSAAIVLLSFYKTALNWGFDGVRACMI